MELVDRYTYQCNYYCYHHYHYYHQPLSASTVQLSTSIITSTISAASIIPNTTVDKVLTFTSAIDTFISSSTTSNSTSSSTIKASVGRLFESYVDGIIHTKSTISIVDIIIIILIGIAAFAVKNNVTLRTNTTNMFISTITATGTHNLPSLGTSKPHTIAFIGKRRLLSPSLKESRQLSSSSDVVILSVTRAGIYSSNTNSSSNNRTDITSNPIRILYQVLILIIIQLLVILIIILSVLVLVQ